jgi:predicted oxidoreductase
MPGPEHKARAWVVAGALALLITACGRDGEPVGNADVIVVGAGISGLATALEAATNGARVMVIDASSVPGGAAVRADGFALVDTALQRARGLHDSPDIAYRDLQAWGEDVDPVWTRRYAESSAREVYDWLTGLGVRFTTISEASGDTVPRLHRTQGGAIHVIVPMMRAALGQPRIEFIWNTRVSEILREDAQIVGVRAQRLRGGNSSRVYRAPAVVLATGGFASDLELVRRSWNKTLPPPERLLIGSAQNATGSGLRLATALGAALTRLDHQEVYVGGLPDPRDTRGDRGLRAENPAAIWIDSTGRRFTNEDAPDKVADGAVLRKIPATYWMIFDTRGRERFVLSGASWLNLETISREVFANPAIVKKADSVAGLAAVAGLPPDALIDTVQRYNVFVEQKSDTDFGRVGPGTSGRTPQLIREPPFYAVQLFPMTLKSMGGVSIDEGGRVLDRDRQPIPGLYACGEVTGVAGISGSFGGPGTFLGPAVLTGRIAARSATDFAHARTPAAEGPGTGPPARVAESRPAQPAAARAAFQPGILSTLLERSRPGYWHFEIAHRLVIERRTDCRNCHDVGWPAGPAITREQRQLELASCTRCH